MIGSENHRADDRGENGPSARLKCRQKWQPEKQQLFPAAVLCESVREKRKSYERVKRQKNEATKRRDNRRVRRQQSEAAVSGGQGECGGLESEKRGKVQAFGV